MNQEKEDYTVLVSIHKSGTNLIGRLIEQIGYNPVGPGFIKSYKSLDKKWLARGRPYKSWAPSPDGLANFIISEYGVGTCACLHRLGGKSTKTASLLRRKIPIIFNYRDPRDVMISEIYYVMNSPPPFADRLKASEVFKNMLAMIERIEYFLCNARSYFDINFRSHEWLLRDPRVLSVSYEELVGSKGGGSNKTQLRMTRKILRHCSFVGSEEKIARKLYSSKARTFRRGRIGSWKEEFSPALRRKFNSLYGDILEMYGYNP